MYELLPLMAGGALALLAYSFSAQLTRYTIIGAGSAVIGASVSALGGELAESITFLFIDTTLALVGSFAVLAAVRYAGQLRARGRPS